MYRCTNLISFCILLWLVFVGHQLYLKYEILTGSADHNAVTLAALGSAQFINVVFAFYGALCHGWMGYAHMWILSLYILPITPIGPVVSVVGIYVLLDGMKLFGPNRFTHRQIMGEMEFRRHEH